MNPRNDPGSAISARAMNNELRETAIELRETARALQVRARAAQRASQEARNTSKVLLEPRKD